METRLAAGIRETPAGAKADEILRACVHCGFCLATCPTYQLLGDELDSPRGRIYQIKQVLEGAPPTRQTQLHLDRCLTCRSCETTCRPVSSMDTWWISAAPLLMSALSAHGVSECIDG